MDTTQLDDLLQELETADPVEAADLAVKAAGVLSEELDPPQTPGDPT
jgi:hypothetical protein